MSAENQESQDDKESGSSGYHMEIELERYRYALYSRILCEHLAHVAPPTILQAIDATRLEHVQVMCAAAIDKNRDYILPSPRELGVVLALGLPIRDVIQGYIERSDELPMAISLPHWNSRELRVVNATDQVGALALHAAGIAFAAHFRNESALVVTFVDDAALQKADCTEAMHFAGMHRLPVIFVHIYFSAPSEDAPDMFQFAIATISIDASDQAAMLSQMMEALQLVRAGHGPVLVNIALDPAIDALQAWRTQLLETGALTVQIEQRIIDQCHNEISLVEKTFGFPAHILDQTADEPLQEKV